MEAESHGSDSLDRYITLAQAARLFPGGVRTATVWRWCRKGVLGGNGEHVRLEHIRAGGRLYTTERWVQMFGKACAASDDAKFARPRDGERRSRDAPTDDIRSTVLHRSTAEINRALESAGL